LSEIAKSARDKKKMEISVYGIDGVLNKVIKINEEIKDIDLIFPGQRVVLPIEDDSKKTMPMSIVEEKEEQVVPPQRPRFNFLNDFSLGYGFLMRELTQKGSSFDANSRLITPFVLLLGHDLETRYGRFLSDIRFFRIEYSTNLSSDKVVHLDASLFYQVLPIYVGIESSTLSFVTQSDQRVDLAQERINYLSIFKNFTYRDYIFKLKISRMFNFLNSGNVKSGSSLSINTRRDVHLFDHRLFVDFLINSQKSKFSNDNEDMRISNTDFILSLTYTF
jgi:hypothetical protein